MAFIVDDGTGLDNATSYVDLVFANEYMTDYNHTAWSSLSDTQKEIALNQGTQYIDVNYNFYGLKLNSSQNLEFPRTELYDCNGILAEGIPTIIKKATCEAAIRAVSQTLIKDGSEKGDRKVEEVSGAVKVEYFEHTATKMPYTLINKLITSSCFSSGTTGKNNYLTVRRY